MLRWCGLKDQLEGNKIGFTLLFVRLPPAVAAVVVVPCLGWCWWCRPRAPSYAPSDVLYMWTQTHRCSSRTAGRSTPWWDLRWKPGLHMAVSETEGGAVWHHRVLECHQDSVLDLWWSLLLAVVWKWMETLVLVPLGPSTGPSRPWPLWGTLPLTREVWMIFEGLWGKRSFEEKLHQSFISSYFPASNLK